MRGAFTDQGQLFSYISPEARVRTDHPLRKILFYGIRSERQLMEQLDYNLLYRWFVGLSPDDLVWDPTVFTKNHDRLQSGEVLAKFMTKLLNHPPLDGFPRIKARIGLHPVWMTRG
jgi:hypothetical protein